MNEEEIIASGILELYVTGALPQEEAATLSNQIAGSEKLQTEVEHIENTLITLAVAVAPPLPAMVWSYILKRIEKVRTIESATKINWSAITGWAAALLAIGGIFWMLNQNNELEEDIQFTEAENVKLEEEVLVTESELAETNAAFEIIRDKDLKAYTLPGNQAVAPRAFVKAYLNNDSNVAYIDAKGLPPAPKGKVYQVWSLIVEPLTPSSMGLLTGEQLVGKNIYKFENFKTPEAFGITLEPEGGSDAPTLSQLYILGGVTGQ